MYKKSFKSNILNKETLFLPNFFFELGDKKKILLYMVGEPKNIMIRPSSLSLLSLWFSKNLSVVIQVNYLNNYIQNSILILN
ncbi:hypothetical protein BpHYR1_018630 [Brachionus plicatilis]|uniref:Uncharacterized protein n=1 Tax=Brachionus plicatilis TaxID=10195 RepID=A0A3M7RVB7_BRAPC|nr:hypothetical protein BpHYR1_018630 [Brachionus plicatilis]